MKQKSIINRKSMKKKNIIRMLLFSNKPYRFLILAIILITYAIFGKRHSLITEDEFVPIRGVITTLVRSNNQSVLLTINMLHSVLKFHPFNINYSYPFVIFHDEQFTMSMREQILSCVLKTHQHAQISFALVNFQTSIEPSKTSRSDKNIGYRLMCRFWIYDIFYHPTIIQGQYNYLMRMDDDSYFSDQLPHDLFRYVHNQGLDYIYRAKYEEASPSMEPLVKRHLNGQSFDNRCIYNNFFVIRLNWYYHSKLVQNFIHELIDDNLILREYIGDGCIHAVMLKLDDNVQVKYISDISYGHNYHLIVAGRKTWIFYTDDRFFKEIRTQSCQQFTVYQGHPEFWCHSLSILVIVYLIIWSITFQSRSLLKSSSTLIDQFLTSTLCGRLIRYPNLILTKDELISLNNQASSFFSLPHECNLFKDQIQISSDELTYPLAYTILIHSNLDQFDFLLRTIYRPHNYYCIHVDSKSPLSLYQSIINRSKCVSNIYLPEKSINVTWGDFSVLEAEHLCQKELLKQSNKWKYYFNLASTDIPLKTNYELVQILKLYNHQNDITSLPYRSLARQNQSYMKRKLPSSISLPLYKGEFHVLLTRETVEYIHSNTRVADLYNYLNGTIVPDEHYYSIINRWKETPGFYPYNHDLSQISFMTRYKIWSDRPESGLCRGRMIRGICAFNYQDLWHLATSPHLFGNKIFFERERLTPYCMAKYLNIRNNMTQTRKEFSMIDKEFYKHLKNVQYGKEKFFE